MSHDIALLVGRVVTRVQVSRAGVDGARRDSIVFEFSDGSAAKLFHDQDCCEYVSIEDVVGDFSDLVGVPLLTAEESSSKGEDDEWGDTSTWTFYKFSTVKGYVDIRWFGSSNGYYSEGVDLRICELGSWASQ